MLGFSRQFAKPASMGCNANHKPEKLVLRPALVTP